MGFREGGFKAIWAEGGVGVRRSGRKEEWAYMEVFAYGDVDLGSWSWS